MAKESLLKKDFTARDVNRARNLITKNFNDKTVSGVGYSKAYESHKEGDVWEENGRTWTIKDGIRQNITKLDTAKKALQTPLACPKCQGSMKHHLSQKMYKIHKMCFDCVIDYETQLRKAGLYEQYERAMVTGSVKALANEMEQWLFDSINMNETFVTEQGDVEDWNNNSAKQKQQLMESMQDFIKHLRTHVQE